MSTRSIIVVIGTGKYSGYETTRLYKHCDGYPTSVLPILVGAIKEANKELKGLREAEHQRFRSNTSLFVGKIIGASTSCYGIGAEIEETLSGAFNKSILGTQSDLEWIYVVDVINKIISVHGGGYTGESPQEHLLRGIVNPIKYVERLKPEYRDGEKQRIHVAIRTLAQLGFGVNKKN